MTIQMVLLMTLTFILGILAPRILALVKKIVNNFVQLYLEKHLRNFVHYCGEGELSLKVLLELVRHGGTMPARTLEITTYGRGVNGLLSPRLTFCPDYKLIQKEPGHYSNFFLVFCHEDEKEKFCSECAEHVVHRNPFEFCGERPARLPACA